MIGPRNTALAFMNALWAGDLDSCFAMMTEDATWTFQLGMPQANVPRGAVWPAREGLQSIVDDLFGKFDGGFDIKIASVTSEDNRVAIEYEASATTATGNPYHNTYVTMLEIRGESIAAIRPYNDTAHMFASIG